MIQNLYKLANTSSECSNLNENCLTIQLKSRVYFVRPNMVNQKLLLIKPYTVCTALISSEPKFAAGEVLWLSCTLTCHESSRPSNKGCHHLAPHVAPSCHLLSHGNSPSWRERCRAHNKRVFPAPSLHHPGHLSPPVGAVWQLLPGWLPRGRRWYARISTGTSWHHRVLTSRHPTVWAQERRKIPYCPWITQDNYYYW